MLLFLETDTVFPNKNNKNINIIQHTNRKTFIIIARFIHIYSYVGTNKTTNIYILPRSMFVAFFQDNCKTGKLKHHRKRTATLNPSMCLMSTMADPYGSHTTISLSTPRHLNGSFSLRLSRCCCFFGWTNWPNSRWRHDTETVVGWASHFFQPPII